MTCETVKLPGGKTAIVCTRGRRARPKCACGRPAHYECDWRVERRVDGTYRTCDAPLCERCTTQPAVGKDLCREHAAEWERRKAVGGT